MRPRPKALLPQALASSCALANDRIAVPPRLRGARYGALGSKGQLAPSPGVERTPKATAASDLTRRVGHISSGTLLA